MTNQEIIDNIKSKLTKNKEVDLPYLRCEFKIYQTMQNDEVMYALLQLIFKYLSNDTKEELDTKTHEVLAKRSEMYSDAVSLINKGNLEEALTILLNLVSTYEKLDNAKVQNYFDFEQMIEYITYCKTVKNAKTLNVKRYPEPVTYYTYQIARIYLDLGNKDDAVKHLEKALRYNPRAYYIVEQLVLLYEELNQYDKVYNLIKEYLLYAYTKGQFAFFYEHLGNYFTVNNQYDIAVASYFASDYHYQKEVNKSKIFDIVNKHGYTKFDGLNTIKSLFDRENINFGPSKELIETVDEFISYSKHLKDIEGVKYLLTIMIELTDHEYYVDELKKLEKVTK